MTSCDHFSSEWLLEQTVSSDLRQLILSEDPLWENLLLVLLLQNSVSWRLLNLGSSFLPFAVPCHRHPPCFPFPHGCWLVPEGEAWKIRSRQEGFSRIILETVHPSCSTLFLGCKSLGPTQLKEKKNHRLAWITSSRNWWIIEKRPEAFVNKWECKKNWLRIEEVWRKKLQV